MKGSFGPRLVLWLALSLALLASTIKPAQAHPEAGPANVPGSYACEVSVTPTVVATTLNGAALAQPMVIGAATIRCGEKFKGAKRVDLEIEIINNSNVLSVQRIAVRSHCGTDIQTLHAAGTLSLSNAKSVRLRAKGSTIQNGMCGTTEWKEYPLVYAEWFYIKVVEQKNA